ncbi:MAG: hypothetical protein MI919_05275, partial [Holophagales bacterium]|nr:hypothetical protein [Holophagales bacterium]
VGLLGALPLARILQALWGDIAAATLATFFQAMASSAAVLLLVTLVAAWLPARRAARIHPAETLRAQ